MSTADWCTTGLAALDRVLQGIRPGDNLVWQVDSIEDYQALVKPFVAAALREKRPLVYFRFAGHKPLVARKHGVTIVELDPRPGFEQFITHIRQVIAEKGKGACYVFDAHSELARESYSDRMLGNFFLLTCPFLYEMETITYFAVFRQYHSHHAAHPIAETAQVLVDVYNHDGRIYVHPLKVKGRFSPTLYLLHAWDGDRFTPITESGEIADVLGSAPWPGLQSASYRLLGHWDRRFMRAEEILEAYRRQEAPKAAVDREFERLAAQVLSIDERILELARRYLALADLIFIWKRMIGCGKIGGKAAGILLARAILRKQSPRLSALMEAHDSFFIGSDVYYTYLVQNGCWLIRQKQKDPETFLEGLGEAKRRIVDGQFPPYLINRFSDMLDYFGQSPIIVRSSSLLEDNFGNAFAGKYDSVFCANQGDRGQRLEEFLNAVKQIYASTMSEDALRYRAKRGVLGQDEQMALLVQRVSGRPFGQVFFPHLAGVAFSYNPYVWNEGIDPEAGMLRLVVGLGTRAVDRADDDYTRVVALNDPELRPEASFSEVKKYAQRRVDLVDLQANRFASRYFLDLVRECPGIPTRLLATLDDESTATVRDAAGNETPPLIVTFDRIFAETPFIADMRELLQHVKTAYGRNVDVEFTANFSADGRYRINLLQCRPLQVRCAARLEGQAVPPVREDKTIFIAHGGVIGQSRVLPIDRVILVVPEVYGHLAEPDRYAVARLVGRLAHCEPAVEGGTLMLLGPGRWGTRMPSLGVPVSFMEINPASVLGEIDSMHEGLVPDLSLGTHFFNEMVEMDMLYLALFCAKEENRLDLGYFLKAPNRLAALLPGEKKWARAVRVIDSGPKERMYLSAESAKQVAVLYRA